MHERSVHTRSNDYAMQRWLANRDDIPVREFDTEGWMQSIQSGSMAEDIEKRAASSVNKQKRRTSDMCL